MRFRQRCRENAKEELRQMGLSICRSIVEAHGGRIGAERSAAHGGARFWFTLPTSVATDWQQSGLPAMLQLLGASRAHQADRHALV
ncbi:ATP-binding protein [Bradyrhizobium sp. AT1]|uniref:ATP-binding protein n=1 Tax=Bradyrhizobium sp. AT1 TaxID=574934 RepID=UPI000A0492FA|nr:ATP-binding protein [Bradyrhizobium sp. AT1]